MYNIEELTAMNDDQLREVAQNLGIKKVDKIDKESLVFHVLDQQAIVNSDNPEPPRRKQSRSTKKAKTADDNKKTSNATSSQPAEEKPSEQHAAPAKKKRGRPSAAEKAEASET